MNILNLNIITLIGSIILYGIILYLIGYNRKRIDLDERYANHYKELFDSKCAMMKAEYRGEYMTNEKNRMEYILDHIHEDDTKIINNHEYILYMIRKDALYALDTHENENLERWGRS